jgi:hypothetical protein
VQSKETLEQMDVIKQQIVNAFDDLKSRIERKEKELFYNMSASREDFVATMN